MKKYGLYTAISLVVANMVGTGVFTSLGYQVLDITSGGAIVMLWLIGGVAALFGALSYAEIGAAMPRSGGEYFYLSRIYHPALGFLSGWVSFLVGFAAPVAMAAVALSSYMFSTIGIDTDSNPWSTRLFAIAVVVLISLVHLTNKKVGARFQNVLTSLKILVVIVLIGLGFALGNDQPISDNFTSKSTWDTVISPVFAIGLFWVSYAYSGWNAAAYIAGEIKNPRRNIPLSLTIGTAFVMLLYILLNYVFFHSIPIDVMAGQEEVGYLFAEQIGGRSFAIVMGGIISFLLLSTISAMILTGPRVTMIVGEDYKNFSWFAHKNKHDIPARAIIIQSIISVIYICTATFEQMLIFIGFTLNLFTFMTVLGVMIFRLRHPEIKRPYRTFGYPVIPILFLVVGAWIAFYGFKLRPEESLVGTGITIIGLLVHFLGNRKPQQTLEEETEEV